MVGILIATHGKMAEGIIDSVELIVGVQENIEAIYITQETSIDTFGKEMEDSIKRLNASNDGVLVCTDILLASPYNKATGCYRSIGKDHDFKVLSGVNLPMILEAISSRMCGKGLEDISLDALKAGHEGITEFFSHMRKLTGEKFEI